MSPKFTFETLGTKQMDEMCLIYCKGNSIRKFYSSGELYVSCFNFEGIGCHTTKCLDDFGTKGCFINSNDLSVGSFNILEFP